MNEQALNGPTPIEPDAHQKIAAQIEGAATTLPEGAVSKTQPVEGLDELRIKSNGGSVRLFKDGVTPDNVSGGVLTEGSVTGKPVEGAYGFHSEAASTPGAENAPQSGGVKGAAVRRLVKKTNPVTGEIVDSTIYDHEFSPANRDKVGQLITALAIKQAARDAAPPEATRKAA
jgi:hypothetical protein